MEAWGTRGRSDLGNRRGWVGLVMLAHGIQRIFRRGTLRGQGLRRWCGLRFNRRDSARVYPGRGVLAQRAHAVAGMIGTLGATPKGVVRIDAPADRSFIVNIASTREMPRGGPVQTPILVRHRVNYGRPRQRWRRGDALARSAPCGAGESSGRCAYRHPETPAPARQAQPCG